MSGHILDQAFQTSAQDLDLEFGERPSLLTKLTITSLLHIDFQLISIPGYTGQSHLPQHLLRSFLTGQNILVAISIGKEHSAEVEH